MTQVEVCVYSLTSALTAQHAGAHTIELCGGQAEGGTTPSFGLIKCVRAAVSIPIHVMIRPRGGDFVYSDSELEVMEADIDAVKEIGADGVVLGLLKTDGTVDESRTKELVARARPLNVTFHRAFDMTKEPTEALDAVIRCGAQRLLTSGWQKTAIDGLDLLKSLVRQANGRIKIVAGSGVSADNATQLLESRVSTLHLSGSHKMMSPMEYRNERISMASHVPGEYERTEADEQRIKAVWRIAVSRLD